MVKVAFVIAGSMHPNWVGGPEIFTDIMASELARLGMEVHIIAYEGMRFRSSRLTGNPTWHGINVKVPLFLIRILTFTVKTFNILLRVKPDVCVSIIGHSVFPCLPYALLVRRPVLVRLAGGEFVAAFKERPAGLGVKISSRLAIEASRKCNIIVLNRDTYFTLRRKGIGRRVFLAPNPIKDEFFNVQPFLQGFNVVYIGRLTEKKGILTLVDAFAEVVKAIPESRLILVGDGPLRSVVEEKIRKLGLEGRVLLTGFIPNNQVPKMLEKASVFILPSYAEGLSNALLQAMAAGLPCIASDIEENREVIDNGVNGMLFPVGNSKALAATIIRVLTDKTLASRLGHNARESVSRFRLKEVLRLYLKILLNSLKEG